MAVVIDENGNKKYVYDRRKYDRSKEYERRRNIYKCYGVRIDKTLAKQFDEKLAKNGDNYAELFREMIKKYISKK